MSKTKFYTFRQNNSGGSFIGNYISYIIEAKDATEAEQIAESQTDIYFDGCDTGQDCSCCGDRWSRYTDENEEPKIWDIKHNEKGEKYLSWGLPSLIIYKNGTTAIFKEENE